MRDHLPASKHSVESTACTLLLQAIHIEWSQAARGGVLATTRNHVPEAFPLTLSSSPAKQPSYLIHHLFYSEADRFEQPYYDAIEVKPASERTHYISKRRRLHALFVAMPHTAVQPEVFGEETIRYDRLSLDWKADRLILDYRYTDGFPYSTPARFTLEPE
jgi:hypothetical protein